MRCGEGQPRNEWVLGVLRWALGAQQWQPPLRKVGNHPMCSSQCIKHEHQAISLCLAARAWQAVCLPSQIWAQRDLGERGLRSCVGTLMAIRCHLAKAALLRDWQGTARTGFPQSGVLISHPWQWGHLFFAQFLHVLIFFYPELREWCWGEKLMSHN